MCDIFEVRSCIRDNVQLSYTSIKSMLPIVILIQQGNDILQVPFVVVWIWDREVVNVHIVVRGSSVVFISSRP